MALPVLSFFVAHDSLPEEHPTAFFEQHPGLPSLRDISARLEGGAYSFPAQFYWDVWAIFKTFSDFFKDDSTQSGRAFHCLANFGTDRLMKWCAKVARTEADAYLHKLRKVRKQLADVQERPLGSRVATAYELAVGPAFGACDVLGKIDPIEYYPIE
jgi:hypothetical protein